MNDGQSYERRFRDDIGVLLPSLVKNGLISEIERRIIDCTQDLMERKSTIYKIVSSKNTEVAAVILESLERSDINVKIEACETNKNHPLLNKVVAKRILELLSLKDILNSRLVCQGWNSTAELIIRKETTIQFKSLTPTTFLKTFQSSIPSVPFASFTISHTDTGWNVSELDEFFEKWGKHIKRLKFDHVNVQDPKYPGKLQRFFDITPWIKKTTNLKELNIELVLEFVDGVSSRPSSSLLLVDVDALKSVENLFASSGFLRLTESGKSLITPRKITLNNTYLSKENERVITPRLNEFIDFSRTSEINVFSHKKNFRLTIDMACQEFKLRRLHLRRLNLENWNEAKGEIFFLYLGDSPFLHANQLQIQQLLCENSTINLTALPKSVEKIHFAAGGEISYSGSVQLPNLNFLKFTDPKYFKEMTNFAYCDKLVEIHLGGPATGIENVPLHVNWIPKSVKIMKISCKIVVVPENGKDNINLDENVLVLGKLISVDYLDRLRTDVMKILSKIKPKVLVVSCLDLGKNTIDTADIIRFVFENQQLGEIIVGAESDLDLHKDNTPFDDSLLSNSVDKKANYYHFQNRKGNSLTMKEFQEWRKMNGLEKVCVNKYRKPIVAAESAYSADAVENEEPRIIDYNKIIIQMRDNTFSMFMENLSTTFTVGEERANFILEKAAESLKSDIYKYKEETTKMFLKRKNMEFLRQEYYGVDETDNQQQRYREAVSVYRLIRQFMTDEEQADLLPWDM